MKKKSELFFSAILVPLDFLMIVLAGLAAYFLRFQSLLVEIRPIIYEIPFKEYLGIVLILAGIWLVIFALSGLYAIGSRRFIDEASQVFLACSAGVMLVIIIIFLRRELFSSRFIVLAAWILSIIFVLLGRLIIRAIQYYLLKKGVGVHRVVIIGQDKTARQIVSEFYKKPILGFRPVAQFRSFDEKTKKELVELIKNGRVDEIIQADPEVPKEETLHLIDFAEEHHIIFKYTTDLFEIKARNIEVNTNLGIPILEIKRTPLDGWGRIFKRIFDVIGALVALVVFSPLMILVACAIKLDSSGPIFFAYKRIGEKGKPFTFIKFRSMKHNTHYLRYDEEFRKQNKDLRKGTPMIKLKNDSRITRVGKFIRRTSIDELPQFFCVLRGTMSLVGPRPHEPEEVARYKKHHKKVLTIKPGITGLAQISGRSDLTFEEEVRLDTYYIENWSLKLDLQILFKTPFVVLLKSGQAL